MLRTIAITLLTACAAFGQTVDMGSLSALRWTWDAGLNAYVSSFGTPNPMLAYSDPENIVGFWHAKHSGGLGVQRTNTSSNSNRWEDLSGGNRPIMLSSFAMTETSGWGADGRLVFNGSSGTATGTVANVVSNMTVLMVFCSTNGGTRMAFETTANAGTTPGAVMALVNQIATGGVESYVRCNGAAWSATRSDANAFTNMVPFSWHSCYQTYDKNTPFTCTYIGNTSVPIFTDNRNPTALFNGVLYLGSRAGSSFRLQGCLSLVAIWKTTLTAAQVSNNVAVAAAQFGL